MPAYITLSPYRPSSRPALMWPLHKLASHQFRHLDGTAVRGFAKYLELSRDKKRQQQMKHIKVARGTHKMLFSSFLSQDGPRRPECFWIYGPLPRAAACSPRADVGILKPTGLWVFTTLCQIMPEERNGLMKSWSFCFKNKGKYNVTQNLRPRSKKNIY